jgi:hypothetical protein
VIRPFFLADYLIEIALQAVTQLACKGTLDFTAAESARDRPAGTSSILALVGPIQVGFSCGSTHSQLGCFGTSGLTPAFFVFPAVQFCHLLSPFLSNQVWIVRMKEENEEVPYGLENRESGRQNNSFLLGVKKGTVSIVPLYILGPEPRFYFSL